MYIVCEKLRMGTRTHYISTKISLHRIVSHSLVNNTQVGYMYTLYIIHTLYYMYDIMSVTKDTCMLVGVCCWFNSLEVVVPEGMVSSPEPRLVLELWVSLRL